MRLLPGNDQCLQSAGATTLAALATVAWANGTVAELERALLDAAAALLGVPAADYEPLVPIAPGAVAERIADPEARLRLLQACLLMAVADGEASPEEWTALEALRGALGVDDSRMKVFQHLARGRIRLARVEMLRRLGGPMVRKVKKRRGLLGVARFLGNVRGLRREDTAMAWRYRRLGLLPEGTLGREYWKYSRENQFAFPGEIGGPDELVVNHDFIHVLTGYGTDPASEFEAGAFTAGVAKEDPFAFVFFVMLQFHMGVSLSPVGTSEVGHFPPARLLAALERGARCTVDLTSGWDHWTVIDEPVEKLREAYGIEP